MDAFVQELLVLAVPVILAITLHEAAHGFVAWRLGDDTAYQLGRVTLNPIRHIDLVGTLILPAVMYYSTSLLFGWAKPVPVNFGRLAKPKRDMVWVALAGPVTNALLALVSAYVLVHWVYLLPPTLQPWVFDALKFSVEINVVLAVFNMIPLPPLDGGRVAVGLLPMALARPLAGLEPYGMILLLTVLVLLPVIGTQLHMDLNFLPQVLGPVVVAVERFLFGLVGGI